MTDKLLYSTEKNSQNRTFESVESFYSNNKLSFDKLAKILSADFAIPKHIVQDSIKRVLVDTIENKLYKASNRIESEPIDLHNYKPINAFFLYYIVMLYFFVLSVFGKKTKKKEKVDILFGICPTLPQYYVLLYKKLKKYEFGLFIHSPENFMSKDDLFVDIKKTFIANASYTNYFLKSISFSLLKKQFFRFVSYHNLSREMNFDLVKIVLQLQKHMAMYSTEVDGISAKVLISAHHNAYNSMRFYMYKKNIGSVILIENGGRIDRSILCSGECYTHCDYYIAFGQYSNRELNNGIKCQNIKYWGSILLDINIEEIKNKNISQKYDFLFIEQLVTYTDSSHSAKDYILCLEYLVRFSNKYPDYKIGYRVRKDKRVNPSKVEKKYINTYKDIIANSNIILDGVEDLDNAYVSVMKSNIVLFYVSSLGIEALALNKKILAMNIDKRHANIFTENDSMCVLYERDYDKFEQKLLYLIDEKNDDVTMPFYKQLKDKYISQEPSFHNKLCNIVETEINK